MNDIRTLGFRGEALPSIAMIQAIYPFDDTVALICNDEGKLLGLPWNRVVGYDIIAGTFFLCDAPPDSENFESLSQKQVRYYSKQF